MSEPLSLEKLVYYRLKDTFAKEELIKFPHVFSRICPIFCLTKKQAWKVLNKLQSNGRIKIVPYHGIRIKDHTG